MLGSPSAYRRKASRIVFSVALLHGQSGLGGLGRKERASILCEEDDETPIDDRGVRGPIRGSSRRDNLRPIASTVWPKRVLGVVKRHAPRIVPGRKHGSVDREPRARVQKAGWLGWQKSVRTYRGAAQAVSSST